MATVFCTGPLNPKRKKARGRIPKRKTQRLTIRFKSARRVPMKATARPTPFPHLLIPTSLFVGSWSSNAVVDTLMGGGVGHHHHHHHHPAGVWTDRRRGGGGLHVPSLVRRSK